MTPKLSVLVATIPERSQQFGELMQILADQHDETRVEIIVECSPRSNIGAKRNRLLKQAVGDYVVFIDDDDMISPDYIAKILAATETKPDCIGISGTITTNGKDEKQWYISKSWGRWFESPEGFYRTPNHISPVRRELALLAGFPELMHGEDYIYSLNLLPMLRTEVIIPGNLYFYRYVTK